jgi:hypothetical protein
MNRRFSPIEKFTKKNEIRERPRSAFADRYIKPSPPFQRPRNPVGRTIENERTPKLASTMPRSFKDSTQLFEELGITTAAAKSSRLDREMPKRDQSFRLPDMTGIQSLIDTTPKVGYSKRTSQKHIPIESVPLPQEEKGILPLTRLT